MSDLLIQNGAKIDPISADGSTPLFMAVRNSK